jgi:hypothetical protein
MIYQRKICYGWIMANLTLLSDIKLKTILIAILSNMLSSNNLRRNWKIDE